MVDGVRGIKAKDGPDLILSGSSTLTSALLEHGLEDEVNLLVYPVLLGKGKRLFAEGTPPRALALDSTKALPSVGMPGNPIADIRVTAKVDFVMKDGIVFREPAHRSQ
jgi:dihydrofolate reductase